MNNRDSQTTVEVLHGFDRWLALADEWEALCNAAERPLPCLRHGWVTAGWELQRHRFSQLMTVLVRERGELVMAGVFELGFRGLGRMLRVPYGGIPQLDDLVWRRSGHTARHARLLLEAVRRRLRLPRYFRSSALREASPLLEAAAAMGLGRKSQQVHTNHIVPLGEYADYPAYLSERGNNLRLDHGRRLRRTRDAGRYELTRDGSPEMLDWLVSRKLDWLARTGRSADWMTSGYTAKFLQRVLLRPGAQPWSIWTARLDGQPFAATLCLEEADAWYLYMVAQDPAMDRLAPGRTLSLSVIEQAFAAGVARLDLGIANPLWKDRLGARHEAVLKQRIRLR